MTIAVVILSITCIFNFIHIIGLMNRIEKLEGKK